MAIKNYRHTYYLSNDNAVTLEMMADEDEELLSYYLKNYMKILPKMNQKELIELLDVFNDINAKLVNFQCLPMYYEVFFHINLFLKDFDNACKYLRSFKCCMDKIETLNNEEEQSQLLLKIFKNYKNFVATINLYVPNKETGKKDSLVKHFLTEDFENTRKELMIRILMRQFKIKRSTALGYHRNYS